MAAAAELFGTVINHEGEKIDIEKHFAGKTLGIYFSAHWCPPCRGFTPVLAEYYKNNHQNKNFEIVFVRGDENEDAFNGYFNEMPWLALPFTETEKNVILQIIFKINFNK